MFIQVLDMIFGCFESVFDSLNIPFFTYKGVEISFLHLLLSFLVLSVFFTFALVPRAGSGLGGIRNISSYIQRESRSHNNDKAKGDK